MFGKEKTHRKYDLKFKNIIDCMLHSHFQTNIKHCYNTKIIHANKWIKAPKPIIINTIYIYIYFHKFAKALL